MKLISSIELNDILSSNLDAIKYNYFDRAFAFQLMFDTGCRVNETIEINRWNIINSTQITLKPQKGNLIRTFNQADLDPEFINSIQNNLPISYNLTTDKLRYSLKTHFVNYGFYIGNKKSVSHIFRHNFAKQLKLRGFTDNQIKLSLGEKNLSSAVGYIYSDVYIY